MATRRRPAEIAAPLLTIVGGAVVVAAAALPWLKSRLVGFRNTAAVHGATTTGLETTIGKVTLVAGIAAVVAGVMAVAIRSRRDRAGAAVLGMVAGASVLVLASFGTITAKTQAIDDAVSTAVPAAKGAVTNILHRLADVGLFKTSIQAGLMLVLAGGSVAFIAAAVTLAQSLRQERSLMPGHEGEVPIPPPPRGYPVTEPP